jgi:hypothetical protein
MNRSGLVWLLVALLAAACAAGRTVAAAAPSSPPPPPLVPEAHVDLDFAVSDESGANLAEPAACPGASVEVVDQDRDGRALGLALLQLSARPWVDLYVDRALIGRTPQNAVILEPGPRDLRLVEGELGYDCTLRLHVHAGLRYAIAVDAEPR